MAAIVVDTGVWIAICDKRDMTRPASVIENIHDRIRPHSIVIPWPVVYETLRTRFVKNKAALQRFEHELKSPRVSIVDDMPYRDEALALTISSSLYKSRPLSMVDCLLRLFIADVNTKIRYFVSFNESDFSDICRKRRIELWSGSIQ